MKNSFEKGPEKDPHEKKCPDCEGQGEIQDSNGKMKKCEHCDGKGWILTQK